jgi:hypothetical protein
MRESSARRMMASSPQIGRPGPRVRRRQPYSTIACLQADTNFAGFIVAEMNTSFFKGSLYFEDRGEITFPNSLILLDPLKRRQSDPGRLGKLTLAPAK